MTGTQGSTRDSALEGIVVPCVPPPTSVLSELPSLSLPSSPFSVEYNI